MRKTSVKKDAKEQARLTRMAKYVLDTYSDGRPDPWQRVRQKYPDLPSNGRTGPRGGNVRFNGETVLIWAADMVAGDQVKQATAARMFQAIAAIALDTKGKPTVRLNALKLLGRECGTVAKTVEADQQPTIVKFQRVIVKSENAETESDDNAN